MKTVEYKDKIQNIVNTLLIKEHFLLHLNPDGNSVKHMMVVAEMNKRGLRHVIRKGDMLDSKYEESMNNLKKSQQKKE